jgi:hypothetical protein
MTRLDCRRNSGVSRVRMDLDFVFRDGEHLEVSLYTFRSDDSYLTELHYEGSRSHQS